jgi:signal transduction histidine kinase
LGRAVLATSTGRSLVLGFPESGRLVLVQLATAELFPPASMEDNLLATRDGDILALGRNWRELPPPHSVPLDADLPGTHMVAQPSGGRLLAFAPLKQWPVVAGASVPAGEALSGWYGALPLYFFFILGPAFAGGGLAVVFVREFERRTRPYSADRLLRAKRADEARLLVRLADAERRAAEAERSKGEFITHMSHELRTPLNAIIGFSEIIEQGLFGRAGHPKYEEYAHDINDAGRKLHARIDEILEFASLEAARQLLTRERIDVAAIAGLVARDLSGQAFARRIRIALSVPNSAHAMGDASALKRSLANVLANAVQYTREGGLVRLQLRYENGDLLISVQDSGLGFSAVERERAGRPFVRFERAGMQTGTGLGLAIAGSLVRRMGGELRISGKPGEGSLVEIRLRRG